MCEIFEIFIQSRVLPVLKVLISNAKLNFFVSGIEFDLADLSVYFCKILIIVVIQVNCKIL